MGIIAENIRSWFYILLLLVCMACTPAAQAQQTTSVPITKLLPAGTAFVYAADTTRLAESVTKLRTIPMVHVALDALEKTLGISLQHDALPWVGQLGFALLDAQDEKPRALLLLEIRDQDAWQHTLPMVHGVLDKLAGMTTTATTYAGVNLHTIPALAWGQFGGWLVIGIGNGAIQHSIDAWQGNVPSLFANSEWNKLMGSLPAHNSFFCVNGDAVARLLAIFPAVKKFNTSALQGVIVAGSMAENEQGERIDLMTFISSPEQQQRLKALRGALRPVDDRALAQLPAGAFAELLCSNAGQYTAFLQHALRGMLADPADQQGMDNVLALTQPLLPIISNDTGHFGVAVSWTKDLGFGLSAASETPSAQQAANQVNLLTTFLTTVLHIPVDVTNGVATIPTEIPYEEMLHAKVCWTAKDAWLKIGTAPELIRGAGMVDAKLPAEAQGADCVFMADLSFLSSLFDHFATQMLLDNVGAWTHGHLATSELPRDGMMGITALRLLGLDQLQCLAYSRIADDGSCWHGVLELNHAKDVRGLLSMGPIIAAALFPALDKYSEKALKKESINNLRGDSHANVCAG